MIVFDIFDGVFENKKMYFDRNSFKTRKSKKHHNFICKPYQRETQIVTV